MAKQEREAHKQSCRKYYEKNRNKYRLDNQQRKKRTQEIVALAKNKSCADCGGIFPLIAMDFDHLRDKKFNISSLKGCSEATLRAEIAKCEVVCSNCHRVRTADRRLTRQDTSLSSL